MFFKSKTYRKSYLKSMLFVLPGIILTVAFVIYPVINTAWLSLNKWNGIGGAPVTWVGLENYIKVLTSEKFWKSMWNFWELIFIRDSSVMKRLIFPAEGSLNRGTCR